MQDPADNNDIRTREKLSPVFLIKIMGSKISINEGIYLFFFILLFNNYVMGQEDEHIHHVAPISALHHLVVGEVLPCCGKKYQRMRMVNNRACTARPAVIVRPRTTEDVATTVNFARRNKIQVTR